MGRNTWWIRKSVDISSNLLLALTRPPDDLDLFFTGLVTMTFVALRAFGGEDIWNGFLHLFSTEMKSVRETRTEWYHCMYLLSKMHFRMSKIKDHIARKYIKVFQQLNGASVFSNSWPKERGNSLNKFEGWNTPKPFFGHPVCFDCFWFCDITQKKRCSSIALQITSRNSHCLTKIAEDAAQKQSSVAVHPSRPLLSCCGFAALVCL